MSTALIAVGVPVGFGLIYLFAWLAAKDRRASEWTDDAVPIRLDDEPVQPGGDDGAAGLGEAGRSI